MRHLWMDINNDKTTFKILKYVFNAPCVLWNTEWFQIDWTLHMVGNFTHQSTKEMHTLLRTEKYVKVFNTTEASHFKCYQIKISCYNLNNSARKCVLKWQDPPPDTGHSDHSDPWHWHLAHETGWYLTISTLGVCSSTSKSLHKSCY